MRSLCPLFVCGLLLIAAAGPAQQPTKGADPVEQHFQAAQTFQLAGDYEKAAVEYREAITRALQRLGNLRVWEGKYSEGIELLSNAAQVQPGHVDANIDLAIAYFYAGEFSKSKRIVEGVLKEDSSNFRALNLLGKIHFMEGDFQAAADRLRAALEQQADFDVAYSLALADLKLRKLADASILFDEMLASMRPTPELHVLIGRAYRETGYLELAAGAFRKAIAADPKYPRAHSHLGLTYVLEGTEKYPEAREQFEAELAVNPDDYTSRYQLGVIQLGEHKLRPAEQSLEQATRLRPDDPAAFFYLGQAYLEDGRMELAVSALEKSIGLSGAGSRDNPLEVAKAHEALAQALEKLGRHERAAAETARALQLHAARQRTSPSPSVGPATAGSGPAPAGNSEPAELRAMFLHPNAPNAGAPPPQHVQNRDALGTPALPPQHVQNRDALGTPALGAPWQTTPAKSKPTNGQESQYGKAVAKLLGQSYHNLGVIEARAGRFGDAAAEFSQAARWNPAIEALDRNWGLAAFRANQYEEAIAPLQRQLRRQPDDMKVREMLGLSYFMTDKFAQSAAIFRPVVDRLPNDPGLLYSAGVALVRSGDTEAGRKLFSRLLEQNSHVPEVHLMLAEAHAQQAEYEQALGEISRALELNPRLPEAHFNAGMVRVKQGKLAEAGEEFQSELAINPQSVPAMYQLAYVRLAQHEVDEAVGLLTQVIAQKPAYADAHYELGKAMLEKGDAKAAIQELESAVRLQPAADYNYYQLSLAYRRAGRVEDAQRALESYQKLKAQRQGRKAISEKQ